MKHLLKTGLFIMASGVLTAGMVWGAPAEETETAAADLVAEVETAEDRMTESETVASDAVSESETPALNNETEPVEIRTIGEPGEQAVKFEFVNGTGKDITYLNILVDDGKDPAMEKVRRMQQALIDQDYLDDVADGLRGPKTEAAIQAFCEKNNLSYDTVTDQELMKALGIDDSNLLKEKELLQAEEQVIVYYEPAQETEDQTAGQEENAENDFAMNQEYIAVFQLEGDGEAEYVLHALPTEETLIRILMEDEIPYVEYTASDTDNLISTLESEKAVRQGAVQENTGNTYYDDGYYDYGYADYDDGFYDGGFWDYDDGFYDGGYWDYDDGFYDGGYTAEPDYYEPVENGVQGADGCIDVDDALLNP